MQARALEAELFGSSEPDGERQLDADKGTPAPASTTQHGAEHSGKSRNHKARLPEAAWIDDNDEDGHVHLARVPKLRKLRESASEATVNGKPALHLYPSWPGSALDSRGTWMLSRASAT